GHGPLGPVHPQVGGDPAPRELQPQPRALDLAQPVGQAMGFYGVGVAVPLKWVNALARAFLPPLEPASRASLSPCSKWIPPYWRDSPACSAAYRKLVHDRVIGLAGTPRWVSVRGSTLELPAGMVTLSSKLPRPVKP